MSAGGGLGVESYVDVRPEISEGHYVSNGMISIIGKWARLANRKIRLLQEDSIRRGLKDKKGRNVRDEVTGVGGELAVYILLGADLDEFLTVGRYGWPDLIHFGVPYQIRTSRYDLLRGYTSDAMKWEGKPVRYIHVWMRSATRFQVMGWIEVAQARRIWIDRTNEGPPMWERPGYEIPSWRLEHGFPCYL